MSEQQQGQQQQTALITGASGGIGSVIAATLAKVGMNLVLAGRDREKLERTRQSLGAATAASIIACDVTDRAQVNSMAAQALEQFKAIDVVICAAGMNVRQRSL